MSAPPGTPAATKSYVLVPGPPEHDDTADPSPLPSPLVSYVSANTGPPAQVPLSRTKDSVPSCSTSKPTTPSTLAPAGEPPAWLQTSEVDLLHDLVVVAFHVHLHDVNSVDPVLVAERIQPSCRHLDLFDAGLDVRDELPVPKEHVAVEGGQRVVPVNDGIGRRGDLEERGNAVAVSDGHVLEREPLETCVVLDEALEDVRHRLDEQAAPTVAPDVAVQGVDVAPIVGADLDEDDLAPRSRELGQHLDQRVDGWRLQAAVDEPMDRSQRSIRPAVGPEVRFDHVARRTDGAG